MLSRLFHTSRLQGHWMYPWIRTFLSNYSMSWTLSWTLIMPISHRSRKSGHGFSYLNIDPWLEQQDQGQEENWELQEVPEQKSQINKTHPCHHTFSQPKSNLKVFKQFIKVSIWYQIIISRNNKRFANQYKNLKIQEYRSLWLFETGLGLDFSEAGAGDRLGVTFCVLEV